MQVLHDPLRAHLPLLKQGIGPMGPHSQIKKQLDTTIAPARSRRIQLNMLVSYGDVSLRE